MDKPLLYKKNKRINKRGQHNGAHLFTPSKTIACYIAGLFLALFTYIPIGAFVQLIYLSMQTKQHRIDREKEKLIRIATREIHLVTFGDRLKTERKRIHITLDIC